MRCKIKLVAAILVAGIAVLIPPQAAWAQTKETTADTAREQAKKYRESAMFETAGHNWSDAESLLESALALTPKYDTTGKDKADLKEILAYVRLHKAEPWRDCNNQACALNGGQKAQAAGHVREALQYYLWAWGHRPAVLALAAGPNYRRPNLYYYLAAEKDMKDLLETITDVAREVQPPLDIPEPARAKLNEAVNRFRSATTPAQTMDAEYTFFDAINLAPFWADAYRVLGSVAKTAGDCDIETDTLGLYLRIAPQASGVTQARSDIAECRRLTDR